jgi:hypothetical protein
MTQSYPDRMADETQEATSPAEGEAGAVVRSKRSALVFDDPLTRPSRDDTDAGWGGGDSHRDEAWYRRETPPHHGG